MQLVRNNPVSDAIDSIRTAAAPESELPIILVGTGPVAIRFAEELYKRGYRGDLVIFGEEPWDPYHRIKLTSLLAGDIEVDEIESNIVDIANHKIVQHLSRRIIAIDYARKTVTDSNNQVHHYHKLVLATGSRARVPDIPGTKKSGIFTFRNLEDTEALLERKKSACNIAVVGGGLLGLEAAWALRKSGANIVIVHQASRLLNRQLDEQGAALLQKKMEDLGIRVYLGSGLAAILGDSTVKGIKLRNDQRLICDTVLLATGIRPNSELARQSWISVAAGIKVDNQMRTSARDVYAIGDCIEHNDKIYGLLLPGYEQAAVLAKQLLDYNSQYLGSVRYSKPKVIDEAVFSVGEVVNIPNSSFFKEIDWLAKETGQYRKLVTKRGRLIGAMAVGECTEAWRILEAVQQHRRLRFWHLWRFRKTGRLWPKTESTVNNVKRWPADAFVCQCMGISKGRLCDAVEKDDVTSVDELSSVTQAGSVCGGCKLLLAELIAS